MLSLRAILAGGLAVYLLPMDPAKQQQFKESALAAAHWTATWCDRNPESCTIAAGVWSQMQQKAVFAFDVAYDLAERHLVAPANTPALPPPRPVPAGRGGNLTIDDLLPAWRGQPQP